MKQKQNLRTWIISEEDSREWKERHCHLRLRRKPKRD